MADNPRIYFAPLEGVTDAVYRRAHGAAFPGETRLENQAQPEILREMRDLLADWMHRPGLQAGLDENGKPICHEFKARPKFRIRQFDASSGVKEFTHLVGEKTAFDAKVMFGDF